MSEIKCSHQHLDGRTRKIYTITQNSLWEVTKRPDDSACGESESLPGRMVFEKKLEKQASVQ